MFHLLPDVMRGPRGRYGLILGALLLLIAGTWITRSLHLDRASATAEEQIAEDVARALDVAERDLAGLEEELFERGEALAHDEEFVRALRLFERDGRAESRETIIRRLEEEQLPDRTALKVYDTRLGVVGWNGYSFPEGDAVDAVGFGERPQVAVARDGDVRRALSVWIPVRDGTTTVGHVRALHLLEVNTPVQNQYLSNYTRSSHWWRSTELNVHLETNDIADQEELPFTERIVRAGDGTPLGRLVAEPPSAEHVVSRLADRYDAVLMLWVTLVLAWVMGGLWLWYRRARGRLSSMALRFVVLASAWWGLRYLLLYLDVPTRWQQHRAPLAPLFDPTHFASTLGDGLMRSAGDFLISGGFLLGFAVVFLGLVRQFVRQSSAAKVAPALSLRGALLSGAVSAGGLVLLTGGAVVLMEVVRHALRDSTLDYFTTTGLLPDLLVLVVFCTLLIMALSFVLLAVGILWVVYLIVRRGLPVSALPVLGGAVVLALGAIALGAPYGLRWFVVLVVGVVLAGAAWVGYRHLGRELHLFSLRSVLLSVIVLAVLLYPMFYTGMEELRQEQMVEAASSFDEGQDPRAVFAVEQLLENATDEGGLRELLSEPQTTWSYRPVADSLSATLLQNSLLASLGIYDVSLTVFDALGRPMGRHDVPGPGAGRAMLDRVDVYEFRVLRQMYEQSLSFGPRVEQITGRREPDRFQYAGIVPILASDGWDPFEDPVGWVMVRAEPRGALVGEATPFPRVLLPEGAYGDLAQQLSLAEFREGRLVRSLGPSFGRYQLDAETREEVIRDGELWRAETLEDQHYLTYYRHQPSVTRPLGFPGGETARSDDASVLAVRIPAIGIFDHLYYLLRLTVAGFFVALPFYLLGLMLRRRAGLLPAPYVRFRDRALNAFLIVGIAAVATVGLVGQRLVVDEADNAVKEWLRQHLERVEEALSQEIEGNEMPYHVIERLSTDELAARVGVDLNIYREGELTATSRPQLVRDRLIDERLPIDVYQDIYYDGYRVSFSEEQLGSFRYMAGYYALSDEQGTPRYVISVPTLPEQERIEQDRARTIAYLFGALLLLVLIVMLTAALLAGALARPIARLRSGLEDVARGRFEQTIPVDSRDEIGELVETFNTMQGQLAESRRKLAQQERQLAWREMARQVAHEIKNPLTPMKLSVQNLRRAFKDAELRNGTLSDEESDRQEKFATYFDSVTSTLIEQINALARIANEFSTFARLPQRVLERLDLNAVVREAVSLMRAEAGVEIALDLHREPLVIEADHEEIRRIFINLIKNAAQAVGEQKEACVRLRTRPVQEEGQRWALCAVADNGPGIPEEVREKIFEPNFSTKTSGTGLGLAIVKKSVEDMEGSIEFETETGRGTTFYIRLPLLEK